MMQDLNRLSRRGVLLAGGAACLSLAAVGAAQDEPAKGGVGARGADGDVRNCVDKFLPPERRDEGLLVAIKEDNRNDALGIAVARADQPPPLGTPRAAIAYNKKWAQNRELKIKFLGGDPKVQKRIQQHAEEWMKYVNITFKFVTGGTTEIRIAFNSNDGSWSFLGTDNLTIPQSRPTMNFGWLRLDSNEATYSSVVLHEFGHMLGCIHEHQSPAAGEIIEWNRQRVIDDCWRDMGWTEQEVVQQIFARYPRNQTQFTKPDRTSIMMYAFPEEWNLKKIGTPWNTKLSKVDIDFMRRQYPKT